MNHTHTHHQEERHSPLYSCPMHPEIRSDIAGLCPECGMALVKHTPSRNKSGHPSREGISKSPPTEGSRSDGRLGDAQDQPKAGVGHQHHTGIDKHKGHTTNIFKTKFWVSLALTIPVVLYSDIAEIAFGIQAPRFPGSQYLALVLGSIVFFYGGWVFLVGAWREVKARLPGMMTLIAIAITAAYLFSVFESFRPSPHTLFWELTTLITIMLLGHWMEMRAVQGAQGALKELSKLLPDTAEVITHPDSNESPLSRGDSKIPSQGGMADPSRSPRRVEAGRRLAEAEGRGGFQNSPPKAVQPQEEKFQTKMIPLSELKEGDVVLVRPGAKVPADGVIVEGSSDINESMVTGESKPVEKGPGAKVIAGTINGDGSLKVQVEKIGEHTFLAGVMRLVAQAQASKSRLQVLSDRAALYLTIIAVVTGLVTFIAWLAARAGVAIATERLVAVLVIACPHALGLAVPLVASISTTMAARNGLLIRQRLALEAARNINVVLFDKTGTLTRGEFGVTDIVPTSQISDLPFSILQKQPSAPGLRSRFGGVGEDGQIAPKPQTQDSKFTPEELAVLQLAASVNSHSEHPIAQAIVREVVAHNVNLLNVLNFQRIAGKGAKAEVEGQELFVGSPTLLTELGLMVDQNIESKVKTLSSQGKTVVFVMSKKHVFGAIALADIIREESREAIKSLREMGVQTAMITGDSEDVAGWVAQELGIDEYFAKVLPEQKSEKVRLLQAKNQKVAMVGDGINDAPALTQADVGVAIGAGTNVAIESAGIILVKNDPRDIPKIIRLSRLTYHKMIQNLFWATGYNIIALPLAAGILASQGILLKPALAAIFMSASTVIVALNAMMLKNQKMEPHG